MTNLIVVTGPTASGKTGFAAHLAHRMNGEIISADSRQVYREMNLGTGKDYGDYVVHDVTVPYHLLDIREPGYKYNVYEFQKDFIRAFGQISEKGKMPFLVGGTGMYVEAVTQGYNLVPVPANEQLRQELQQRDQEELVVMLKALKPELHNTTDIGHKKRTIRAIEIATYYADHTNEEQPVPVIRPVILGVKYDRDSRRKRISERLRSRLKEGMIEEVEGLLKKLPAEDLIFYGLEYKYITMFILGQLTREEMVKKLEVAIHQFAKRQMTWFRKMERDGVTIHWLDGHMTMEEKLMRAENILKKYDLSFKN